MAERLSDDIQLDTPTTSAKQLPNDVKLDAPREEPSTSFGGVLGSAARGALDQLGPMGAGAALGGAIGGPPGAAVGASTVGAAETLEGLYNTVASQFGWPQVATPAEQMDRLLDYLGVPKPATGIERGVQSGVGGAASAFGMAKALGKSGEAVAKPLLKKALTALGQNPVQQAGAGLTGGLAGQAAAEAGAGPLGQGLASTLAGGVYYAPTRAHPASPPKQNALDAMKLGYKLRPAEIAEHPGAASTVISGFGGRIKTEQEASARNQAVTNRLGAQALGLPPDTTLTEDVFKRVRDEASKAYQAVSQAVPFINVDTQYLAEVNALGGQNRALAMQFPNIGKNPEVRAIISDLRRRKKFTPETALELVKQLRSDASANLWARKDPKRYALGFAQREAADAVDNLMERNLAAAGKPDLVDQYRKARQLIAKSYDVEFATNPSNQDVSARIMAALSKRRPLSGELKSIADTFYGFPKVMQSPSAFGFPESLSLFDVGAGLVSAMHGHPEILGLLFGRPLGRKLVLSGPYQRMASTPRSFPTPLLTNPGLNSIVQPSDGDNGTANAVLRSLQ